MKQQLIEIAYLVSAIMFIYGMKRLQSPATARKGNQLAAMGMLVAIVATLFFREILTPVEMLAGVVVGGGIGAYLAKRVEMTGMPELVAAFNGFGGIASALVAGAEIARFMAPNAAMTGEAQLDAVGAITISLSIFIGMITFTGSFVAFGKLSGRISGNPVTFPGMRMFTILFMLASIAGMVWMAMESGAFPGIEDPVVQAAIGIAVLGSLLGVLLVIPIGGADMPVVVALLNSYSGLAASATGFVLNNTALIVSGALVGASGLILTNIMCDAMNRSLFNVLIGGFGGDSDSGAPGGGTSTAGMTVNSTSADDVAILLSYANKVIFVPGYGMAVAQAQHAVRELSEELAKKDVEVKFAVHPVAGRMPGHMNVLLAEANVPYDQLFEMDDINGEFETTDVAVVIGANDVVNPAARHDKSSPIFGMPILNVDHASTSIVLKRSMNPGYAGIDNELFYNSNNQMLFGDAKASISDIVNEVKQL
ncbi:MAG: NAD(P)(+) transhydrogenase (Re/Si-specific) subunit beta [Bacteroidetes Order II. Incertae sedis bacterium]|jgi:H+-translocating NAD(P) transhydrogenase subunit beta|nr:NAD(P)(+) transhydrogenase (Re/Si-specific) subunit beta [Bacteroidetes Order II. bacterium]MBT5250998.1 NAD(P)(+) transhydrogenase (Re/Si-specific) subunit beta [Bacteroidetes Order II. bacterium]MBT6201361.1 NAD(P)(+) transhydrogenase (Re/Si-specific) subunit beta [Bacteroidetes Order II. bacterium]MBT6425365.1 NAD(P)(+) transhydrogenase (Re/Si-specific) subunit beta [Bacteroidetes Order II. bacterium]MBT6597784.1 NAD(P)(+) transhydrogenase (Re/Si-specific) subunit beta [Bacteroidetes Orde